MYFISISSCQGKASRSFSVMHFDVEYENNHKKRDRYCRTACFEQICKHLNTKESSFEHRGKPFEYNSKSARKECANIAIVKQQQTNT